VAIASEVAALSVQAELRGVGAQVEVDETGAKYLGRAEVQDFGQWGEIVNPKIDLFEEI
jgi:hypothetical protein